MKLMDLGEYVLSSAINFAGGTKNEVKNHCERWFGDNTLGHQFYSTQTAILMFAEAWGVYSLSENHFPAALALGADIAIRLITPLINRKYNEESMGVIGCMRTRFEKPKRSRKKSIVKKGSYDGWLDMNEVQELNQRDATGLQGNFKESDFQKLLDDMHDKKYDKREE